MNGNIAFLELKYGNIYGGYPNYFVISEASVLVFDTISNKVFIESFNFTADLDIVFFNTKVNDLGHTIKRLKYVQNLASKKKLPYDEEFKLPERDLEFAFKKSRNIKKYLQNFFRRVNTKYQFDKIITFDGNRDVFLLERAGIDFKRKEILDIQRELNKTCGYLFSLKKLAVVINYKVNHTSLTSNNLNYFLHPIAAKQLQPKTAAMDAAKLMMLHNEFYNHRDDFLMKAALLLNKIQQQQQSEEKSTSS